MSMSVEKSTHIADSNEYSNTLKVARERIDQAIEESLISGQITLLFHQYKNLRLLAIMEKYGQFCYFAQVSQRSQRRVSDLEYGNNPFDLILPSKRFTTREMAAELPAFLNSYYPHAKDLPIIIYRSKQEFFSNQPLRRVKFINNLVKVKTA